MNRSPQHKPPVCRTWTRVLVCGLLALGGTGISGADPFSEATLGMLRFGIRHAERATSRIQFKYRITNVPSQASVADQRAHLLSQLNGLPPDQLNELRSPGLESSARTGAVTAFGTKYAISGRTQALRDHEDFEEKEVFYDGLLVRTLNVADRRLSVEQASNTPSDIFWNPRTYPYVFMEGRPLSGALAAANIDSQITGIEDVDGTRCMVVDMRVKNLDMDGLPTEARRICWIAMDKGFMVKKAVAYSVRHPGEVISKTECELSEVAPGIWYYRRVQFRSMQVGIDASTPYWTSVLEIRDIELLDREPHAAFSVNPMDADVIEDHVTGALYRTEELNPVFARELFGQPQEK